MKLKLFILSVFAAVGFAASADSYLYWMVGDNATLDGGSMTKYDTIKVVAFENQTWASSYLNLYSTGGSQLGTSVTGVDYQDNSAFYAGLSGMDYSNYSFYIELYNDQTFVGRTSDGFNYSDATAYVQSSLAPTATPAKLWTSINFIKVPMPSPEPSSGLLMLLGCAILGLRRKKNLNA